MTVDYGGLPVRFERRSNTYSRPPVKVNRICKHGFKRELKPNQEPCPCYKCDQERRSC